MSDGDVDMDIEEVEEDVEEVVEDEVEDDMIDGVCIDFDFRGQKAEIRLCFGFSGWLCIEEVGEMPDEDEDDEKAKE